MTKHLGRSVSTYFTEFLKNHLKEQYPFPLSGKHSEQLLRERCEAGAVGVSGFTRQASRLWTTCFADELEGFVSVPTPWASLECASHLPSGLQL